MPSYIQYYIRFELDASRRITTDDNQPGRQELKHSRLTRALPATLLLLAGSAAIAGANNDVVVARQTHYRELGKAFKAINDQLRASTPDLAVISANAPVVARLAQQQNRENWFLAGTQAGQGLQTAANASIWKNPTDFNAKRADFAKAAAGYAAIVAKGDLDAIKAATGAVGKNCKGCHDSYRDQDRS